VPRRERGLTPWTRQRACSHTPILQHLQQRLCQTKRTDIVLRESSKRIDCRTTVQGRQFILALQDIGNQSHCWSRHRTYDDPHGANSSFDVLAQRRAQKTRQASLKSFWDKTRLLLEQCICGVFCVRRNPCRREKPLVDPHQHSSSIKGG
jgi:hypothetical protein